MAIEVYREFESGDERILKPFILFGGDTKYNPSGGATDIVASADTVEELKKVLEMKGHFNQDGCGWWHIAEKDTLKIIEYEIYN